MFRWGAEEPEYARMGGVEMYAAGKRALDQREGPETLPDLVPTLVYVTLAPFIGVDAYEVSVG